MSDKKTSTPFVIQGLGRDAGPAPSDDLFPDITLQKGRGEFSSGDIERATQLISMLEPMLSVGRDGSRAVTALRTANQILTTFESANASRPPTEIATKSAYEDVVSNLGSATKALSDVQFDATLFRWLKGYKRDWDQWFLEDISASRSRHVAEPAYVSAVQLDRTKPPAGLIDAVDDIAASLPLFVKSRSGNEAYERAVKAGVVTGVLQKLLLRGSPGTAERSWHEHALTAEIYDLLVAILVLALRDLTPSDFAEAREHAVTSASGVRLGDWLRVLFSDIDAVRTSKDALAGAEKLVKPLTTLDEIWRIGLLLRRRDEAEADDESIDDIDEEEIDPLTDEMFERLNNILPQFKTTLIGVGLTEEQADAGLRALVQALEDGVPASTEQRPQTRLPDVGLAGGTPSGQPSKLSIEDAQRAATILSVARPKAGRPPLTLGEMTRLARIVAGEIPASKDERKAARDRLNSAKRRLKRAELKGQPS